MENHQVKVMLIPVYSVVGTIFSPLCTFYFFFLFTQKSYLVCTLIAFILLCTLIISFVLLFPLRKKIKKEENLVPSNSPEVEIITTLGFFVSREIVIILHVFFAL